MRIAICQIENSADLHENMQTIYRHCSVHSSDCDLIAFPECALTGFSPRISFDEELVSSHFADLTQLCVDTDTTVFLPSVVPCEEGRYNSGYIFHPDGERTQFFKEGLTDSERQFFTPGTNASRTFRVLGQSVAFLLCMEASEEPWKYLSPDEHFDVILWPAYWGWRGEVRWDESLEQLSKKVYLNMGEWKTPLLQVNYAFNSPSDKRKTGPEGLSVVVDGGNRLVHKGPHKRESVSIIIVGEKGELVVV
jgi:predicted amidohydrolase